MFRGFPPVPSALRAMLAHPALRAGLVAALLAAPAMAAEDDFNVWTGQFVTFGSRPSDSWIVRLEAQQRFTDDADRLGQLLLRSYLGYRVSGRVHAGGGYAYILTDPVGPPETHEHRIYQELNIRLVDSEGGIRVDARTRLEQRLFEDGGEMGWRFRQWVQLRAPLVGRTRFVAQTEPFIGLNETRQNRRGVALWRNFAGIALPLGATAEIVPGYLNQYVVRDGEDRMDHIANVNLFLNF